MFFSLTHIRILTNKTDSCCRFENIRSTATTKCHESQWNVTIRKNASLRHLQDEEREKGNPNLF